MVRGRAVATKQPGAHRQASAPDLPQRQRQGSEILHAAPGDVHDGLAIRACSEGIVLLSQI